MSRRAALVVRGAVVLVCVAVGRAQAAQELPCPTKIGDMNGDGKTDLTDAIQLLICLVDAGRCPMKEDKVCPVERVTELEAESRVPATGQTICYESGSNTATDCETCASCVGQDGYYYAGCPILDRFTDNGDGTVTDECTKLMWQKSHSPTRMTWWEGLTYCEKLELADYTDWRLPNIREYQTLVDYGKADPAIDNTIFDVDPSFWFLCSSTSDRKDPTNVWYIDHRSGRLNVTGKSGLFFIRAVRGGRLSTE